jgi:hypothetical protein
MINTYESGVLEGVEGWRELRLSLDPEGESDCLDGILEAFRNAGGVYYILEGAYLDRDYVRAYAAFHHRVYAAPNKHCKRLHVFNRDLTDLEDLAPGDLASALEAAGAESYLGFLVLRPVVRAPVSWAVVAVPAGLSEPCELLVASEYSVHLLGAELKVTGAAATEQDGRTGSCAQAVIWGLARHFHNHHKGPWLSIIDVNAAALTPTDVDIAAMLPAGSRRLTADAMVRALKGLGYHPLVYRPNGEGDWYEPAHRIVGRYLDSGIPVIIGLNDDNGEHAVLAVGTVGHRSPPKEQSVTDPPGGASAAAGEDAEPELDLGPNIWDYATYLLVNDDQSGPYRRLAIGRADCAEEGDGSCLEDASFILPVLPETVFMPAEGAETVARRIVAFMTESRGELAKTEEEETSNDDEFFADDAELVARTYLSNGWKHAWRALRNDVPDELKEAMVRIGFPKWVWVTEFSLREDIEPTKPERRVRAHAVVDPTSSHLLDALDSAIAAHVPGHMLTVEYDQDKPGAPPFTAMQATLGTPQRYFAKARRG